MKPCILKECYSLNPTSDDDVVNELSNRFVDLCSGSVAGAIQIFVAHPFDTVKVKEQLFPHMYKNMFDCFVKTYRSDGLFRGLYAGCVPALCANVGETAVLFVAYASCRKFVSTFLGLNNVEDLPIAGEAMAGGLSTVFSVFVVCPTELVKCRMQAMKDLKLMAIAKNKPIPAMLSVGKLVRSIYATQGIPGFYRGLVATFARDFPGYTCFFGCYEGLKDYMRKPYQKRAEVGPLVTLIASGVAGIFLWLIAFPADVLKSHIQINNISSSIFAVGKHIVCKEGIHALYHGFTPTMIQTVPATATLFFVYEYVKRKLNHLMHNKRDEKYSFVFV